ncbi:BadF/BadG/BcrA/BcrD ATPase family protein [Thermomonospora umbrina]|uniref:BadF/BadG/BcrA/BcrD ATPase family protein n=1 Tax=Thermomonospora umbrina TaxID=111806 RepID=A0A3D9SRB4_9ACTN|nr:BadF/BadG/BcrA/BcrD ATPase family protein [Thermomonospora umbrina]REE98482.1 BadF/BadG/BcrA/BcrD ATPase family protein [Thermomonospora umbrina]
MSAALGDLDRSLVLNGVFGIAGAGSAGRPAAVAAARQAWHTVGLHGTPAVVTDIAVAFAAGTSAPEGIVVFSGTGAGAAVINDGTIVQRADGYGWLVGDEGSAVWLGREAVRATLAAIDGRGEPTLLAESVPRALLGAPSPGLLANGGARAPNPSPDGGPSRGHVPRPRTSPERALALVPAQAGASGALAHRGSGGAALEAAAEEEPPSPDGRAPTTTMDPPMPRRPADPALAQAIIKEVYGRPPAALGRLGPVVCAAAAAGDPVARHITQEAAQWLLRDVDAVRPALSDRCSPVVMAGSVLGDGPVAEAVRDGLRERFPADPQVAGDGAVGAAGMALRRLGLRPPH